MAWVGLAAALLAAGIAGGVVTFLALRPGDDEQPKQADKSATVAFGERLIIPDVVAVTVRDVQRMKRVAPRDRGARPVAAHGEWLVATIEVTNLSHEDQTVSARVLEVEDDKLIYTGGGGAASSQELFLRHALHGRTLHPGQTATGALAYDVPERARPQRLRVPHSWAVLDVDDPKVVVSYAQLRP